MGTRTPIIVGNWKMNLTLSQALDLVKDIRYGLPFPGETDVAVAPPFLWLQRVAEYSRDSYIGTAAQDLHEEDQCWPFMPAHCHLKTMKLIRSFWKSRNLFSKRFLVAEGLF